MMEELFGGTDTPEKGHEDESGDKGEVEISIKEGIGSSGIPHDDDNSPGDDKWEEYFRWREECEANGAPQEYTHTEAEEPSTVDMHRAALCCLAVYESNIHEVQRLFDQFRGLNFRKVILSPMQRDNPHASRQRFLIATTADKNFKKTVYVAFSGTQLLEDCKDSSKVGFAEFKADHGLAYDGRMSGLFHRGFHNRLREFVPRVADIIDYCQHLLGAYDLENGFRVVFCGHSLGGAMSQMALLCRLLSISSDPEKIPRGKLMSITFGAPLFCNDEASNFLTNEFPVSNMFFNYIMEGDIVPILLNNIQATIEEVKRGTLDFVKAKIDQLASTCVSPTASLFASQAIGEITRLLLEICKQYPKFKLSLESAKSEAVTAGLGGELQYCPFGTFMKVKNIDRKFTSVPIDCDEVSRMPVEVTVKCLKAHTMTNYFRVFEPPLSDQFYHEDQMSSHKIDVRIGQPPSVVAADLHIVKGDADGVLDFARITVKGCHLSLLKVKDCRVSTFENQWEIDSAESNEEYVTWKTMGNLTAFQVGELSRRHSSGMQVASILLVTAFGTSGHNWHPVFKKECFEDSKAINTLSLGVAKYLLLQETSTNLMKHTGECARNQRGIETGLQSVASLVRNDLFEDLRRIATLKYRLLSYKKNQADTHFVEIVRENLCHSKLALHWEPSFLEKGAVAYVSAFMSIKQLMSRIYGRLTATTPELGYSSGAEASKRFLNERTILDTYGKILDCLQDVVHLKEWRSGFFGVMRDFTDYLKKIGRGHEGTILLEKRIYKRLKKDAVQEGHDAYSRYQGWMGRAIREEARKSVVDRLRLFESIMNLSKAVKSQMVVAIVGPENTGKSTLINLLTGDKSSVTGGLFHTDDVKGYLMKDSDVIVVDFPGCDAPQRNTNRGEMWKTFGRCADLYIVLLKFTGDCKASEENLLKEVVRNTEGNRDIMVMVNQVDSVLKGRPRNEVWKEYSPEKMDELKSRYKDCAGHCGVKLSDDSFLFSITHDKEQFFESEVEEFEYRDILIGDQVTWKIKQYIQSLRSKPKKHFPARAMGAFKDIAIGTAVTIKDIVIGRKSVIGQ